MNCFRYSIQYRSYLSLCYRKMWKYYITKFISMKIIICIHLQFSCIIVGFATWGILYFLLWARKYIENFPFQIINNMQISFMQNANKNQFSHMNLRTYSKVHKQTHYKHTLRLTSKRTHILMMVLAYVVFVKKKL